MRVLAIDPGVQTGIALFDSKLVEVTLLHIVEGGLQGFQNWWQSNTTFFPHDVLVVESFELEQSEHTVDTTPVEVIGYLKSLGIPIVWQRRMERGKNKLCSDAVLKRAGLYPPRGSVGAKHQVEALRHCLSYLIQQKDRKTLELLHPRED